MVNQNLPEERYGKKSEETDGQLEVAPIPDYVRHEGHHTPRGRPEHLDNNASKRPIFGSKEFTGHHKTRQDDTLNRNNENQAILHG